MSDAGERSADLLALSDPVRARFDDRHRAREESIQRSRETVRDAANAIRAVHRGEDDVAAELLADARERFAAAVAAVHGYPEILHAGFVADAAKEYAEAVLTRAALAGQPLPGPEEIGVDDTAWLHGLAETVGELRRACLDRVRAGDLASAEAALGQMQEIQSVLVTIDAPDGLTRGLRRATDASRAIIERTRGDVTTAVGQRALREALDAHRDAIERMLGQA